MKLKTGFVTQNFHGQQLMVAVGEVAKHFHGLVRSNETAAFIIECLKTETSKEEIISSVLSEYEADEYRVRKDVACVIEKLRSIGAIEE